MVHFWHLNLLIETLWIETLIKSCILIGYVIGYIIIFLRVRSHPWSIDWTGMKLGKWTRNVPTWCQMFSLSTEDKWKRIVLKLDMGKVERLIDISLIWCFEKGLVIKCWKMIFRSIILNWKCRYNHCLPGRVWRQEDPHFPSSHFDCGKPLSKDMDSRLWKIP